MYSREIGNFVTLKSKCIKKYGLHKDYIKRSNRPFCVAEITDYNAIWVVPCYSHCNQPKEIVDQFHQELTTPDGSTKYLNFRNMLAIEFDDISSDFKANITTVQNLIDNELKLFKSKFIKVKSIMIENNNKHNWELMNAFYYEKTIFKLFSESTYSNLEIDFNIVNKDVKFCKNEQWEASDFSYQLYKNFIKNLLKYRVERDVYIPNRRDELTNMFKQVQKTRLVFFYTEQGFISSFQPKLEFTNNIDQAMLVRDFEYYKKLISLEFIEEYKELEVPLLDREGEMSVAKELIFLDHNVVSHRSFFRYYGQINKRDLNRRIELIKQES